MVAKSLGVSLLMRDRALFISLMCLAPLGCTLIICMRGHQMASMGSSLKVHQRTDFYFIVNLNLSRTSSGWIDTSVIYTQVFWEYT